MGEGGLERGRRFPGAKREVWMGDVQFRVPTLDPANVVTYSAALAWQQRVPRGCLSEFFH